jgi:hypothetical protein
MENIQAQGALDFSAPFLFVQAPQPGQKLLPQHSQVQPRQPRKPKPEPQQPAKAEVQGPALKLVPRHMVEKEFATGDYIVWDTVDHCELFRGTRDEALNF